MGTGAAIRNTDEESRAREEALMACTKAAKDILAPMILRAALNLKLFDIVATCTNRDSKSTTVGQATIQDIANKIATTLEDGTTIDMSYLARMLRFLVSRGFLRVENSGMKEQKQPYYTLTLMSKLLVKDVNGDSLAPYHMFITSLETLVAVPHIHQGIVGKQIWETAHGLNFFEMASADPNLNKMFNDAMTSHAAWMVDGMIDRYDGFGDAKTVVDVGGGMGGCIKLIQKRHPNVHGINFDLPYVLKDAPPCLGIEHVTGNFFDSIPSGDIIILKASAYDTMGVALDGVLTVARTFATSRTPPGLHFQFSMILHDWADEDCVKILKNCRKAMSADIGKVIVMEPVVPDIIDNSLRTQLILDLDMTMLVFAPGGRERTLTEIHALGTIAAFTSCNLVFEQCHYSLVELTN